MKRLFLSGILVAAIAVSTQASATTFTLDFVAEAAGNERGVADGTTLNFGGLGVTFSAGNGGAGSDFAYFDDLSNNKPGGLGVCTTLTPARQCSPSDDDNISRDETVTLSFDRILSDLSGFSFSNQDHDSLAASMATFAVKVENTVTAQSASTTLDFAFMSSNSLRDAGLTFNFNKITFSHVRQDYYINAMTAAVVPLPAAAPLLLGGLGLLGAIARRRRRAV